MNLGSLKGGGGMKVQWRRSIQSSVGENCLSFFILGGWGATPGMFAFVEVEWWIEMTHFLPLEALKCMVNLFKAGKSPCSHEQISFLAKLSQLNLARKEFSDF